MQNWEVREERAFFLVYLKKKEIFLISLYNTPPSDKRDKIKDLRAGDKSVL